MKLYSQLARLIKNISIKKKGALTKLSLGVVFLKKLGQPRPLFVYFRSFQTNKHYKFLQQIDV